MLTKKKINYYSNKARALIPQDHIVLVTDIYVQGQYPHSKQNILQDDNKIILS